MIAALRFLRGLLGTIAAWQVFGLLPVLGWGGQDITGQAWAIVFVKAATLFVFGAVFFALRPLINKIHSRKNDTAPPLLATKWSL